MLDKAEYSAFQSTLNSPIVSYRIITHAVELFTLLMRVKLMFNGTVTCLTRVNGEVI